MSDNYIKVTVTGNKSKSVSVKSTELKNQITAGADMSLYYSNKAKEWAISDKLVDNEDYSSKYHANLAKSYAEEGALQIAEITTLRELTLADIETEKQNVIDMGTEQINQVSTISNTAISDIETSKTNALSDIDSAKTIVLEDISTQETQTINNIKETADVELDKIVGAGIDSRANIDLSNLSEVGGKHFLGKSQITNCITEIPQRIKADVVDGTLTVYAGSVAIVPYGTTDRTSEFPVGSTFIHENFKVVDTQFADDKFFVWVEVQSDIIRTTSHTVSENRFAFISLINNIIDTVVNSESGTSSSATNRYTVYYNTNTNMVGRAGSTTELEFRERSLPIFIHTSDGTNMFASITQTFNGIGYIGSTIWVDKGVKGLIPNGRNEDGSLKNIEFTTERISMRTFASSSTGYVRTFLSNTPTIESQYTNKVSSDYVKPTNINYWYNILSNKWILCTTDEQRFMFSLADCYLDSGVISDFKPKMPFRAVDYSDVHVKTYVNGTSWYRIHPDGWIEQGGVYSFKATTASTVNLIKPFRDTNYTLFAQAINLEIAAYSDGYQHVYGKTTTSFKRNSYRAGNANWYACGY